MNIIMMTNTYLPHVGGVAQSVKRFSEAYRREGHRVLIVAPTFEGMPENEEDVLRVPAIQNFNGSDFSVSLTMPPNFKASINDFQPDIIHSHHPFLLGNTALRVSALRQIPLVFTYHTMYEDYVQYVPVESERMKTFAKELATRYANRCDHVIAPSGSVKDVLLERGVAAPITVIPTGVDVKQFSKGDGARIRGKFDIPKSAFVVGHVGRLAPEKNLEHLTRALAAFLVSAPDAHALVVGGGPSEEKMHEIVAAAGVTNQFHFAGKRQGQELVDAYHAMDAFAFSSQSETQGMVLVEAMAAGKPVVALDANGVRDVVIDRKNGRLITDASPEALADAIAWVRDRHPRTVKALFNAARKTARAFSTKRCARLALELYQRELVESPEERLEEDPEWQALLSRIEEEWKIWSNHLAAAAAAVRQALPTPGANGVPEPEQTSLPPEPIEKQVVHG